MESTHHTSPSSGSEKLVRMCESGGIDVAGVWSQIRARAGEVVEQEHGLRVLLEDVVLSRPCLGEALGVRLARKLAREDMTREELAPLISGLLADHP